MSAASSPNPAASNGQVSASHPLRSALKSDDDLDRHTPASGSLKAVHIADTDPEIQLLEDESQPMRQFPAGPKRRLSGKLPLPQLNGSSRSSVNESPVPNRPHEEQAQSSHHQSHHRQYYSEKLLAQVNDWLEHEKRKASSRKQKTRRQKSKSPPKDAQNGDRLSRYDRDDSHVRSESVDSQGSDVSFDRLQRILEDSMAHMGFNAVPNFPPKASRPRARKSSSRNSLRAVSSDTDYVDGDIIVPSCDAWLDNSKTMSYGGGGAGEESAATSDGKADKEREVWTTFKNEIIRIMHTLRLKGWRRVQLGAGDSISVQRLSGALTNAVYVVSPPADLPDVVGKRRPAKVLLRIYGPQVEHLIDRENELSVLQRLARNKIGPRLLGTFQNGRFEQFFNAITLTPPDLRDPYLSRQIAKRMRELHDGIELLTHERQNGPSVWRSWDQWLENVGRITSFLDNQYESETEETRRDSVLHAWKANGYVCGTSWTQFKETVIKYRAYLESHYEGRKDINNRLSFTHSDAQYGNILRIRPDDEKSPLLQPANQHKQLIVIDFEYAGANLRGYEFANHFDEWTYNYHDPVTSWACNHRRYPTPEEQKRFLKAYVEHRPKTQSTTTTPRMMPSDGSLSSGPSTPLIQASAAPNSSSIVDFMLDARVPPGGWSAAERANEERSDERVRELSEETRLWRPATHIHWIAWGIVQAKIPGLDVSFTEDDVGPDEFDYLSYAQDRVLFFWGDCVQMGLVKKEELPENVQSRLKIVEY